MKNQPATIQIANKPIRDTLKLLKSKSAVLNLAIQQASFSVLILLYLRRPPHKRKTRLLLHKLASLFCCSVLFLWFPCGAWPSTRRGVAIAPHIFSMKIRATKISSRESGRIFTKFRTRENFLLYTVHISLASPYSHYSEYWIAEFLLRIGLISPNSVL